MKCDIKLTPRQKNIITYLLCCRTVKEAAQKAGVRLATVFRWLKDPLFKAELDRLREEVISDVVDRLKVHCMKYGVTDSKDCTAVFVIDYATTSIACAL